jgi:hypothetical protein
MLGGRKKFSHPPFFWSMHYDLPILYVGHAEKWDELSIEGDVAGKDCAVRYKRQGRVLAVATVNRDVESLKAEVEMERAPARTIPPPEGRAAASGRYASRKLGAFPSPLWGRG